MEILKLINRIDNQVESKNTQELLLDLGNVEKANERIASTQAKLKESVARLQELLDERDSVEFFESNLNVISESFASVYLNTDISIDTLKQNSIGKEELYLYLDKISKQK